MRVPGSLNVKPKHCGWTAKLTEGHWDRVWELDVLVGELGLDLNAVQECQKRPVSSLAVPRMENIDPVLTWLYGAGYVLKDEGGDWVKITCPWLQEDGAGHTTGPDAGYSPLGRGDKPEYRGFSCLHDHPAKHSTSEFLEWVAQSGGPECSTFDPIPLMLHRYVLVEEDEKVVDLQQRPFGGYWLMTWSEFGKRFPGNVKLPGMERAVSVKNAWLMGRETRRAARLAYEPGGADFVEEYGQQCVNVWREPDWPETDMLPSVFLEHMHFLIPDQTERERFLDWLAFKVQNPGKRSYAITMVAEGYGVGRSVVGQFIHRMLQGDVSHPRLADLIGKGGQFNGWARRCQFVIVEEAKDVEGSDFYSGYETFKQYVDTRAVPFTCNPKYEPQREEVMYFNVVIFTNHVDALVLPEEDRRVDVITNPRERREPAYYARLEAALDGDEPQRLYWYLKRREVSGFDHANPPMTRAKRRMIDATASPIETIKQRVQDNCTEDLITRQALFGLVHEATSELGVDVYDLRSEKVAEGMWRRLGQLSGDRRGLRVRGLAPQLGPHKQQPVRVEVRALRNQEQHFDTKPNLGQVRGLE